VSIICVDTFIDAEGEVIGRSGRVYRFEFHEMFGPTLIGKNGEVLKRQSIMESETHEFWAPFNEWLADWKRRSA
jgi:hypothetical protein